MMPTKTRPSVVLWCVLTVTLLAAHAPAAGQDLYPVDYRPLEIVAVDLNADSLPDLAAVNSYSDNVSVLLNDGAGGFYPAGHYAVGNLPVAICYGDLDGDGDRDLAIACFSADNVTVLFNDGTGAFPVSSSIYADNAPRSICAADWDGDLDVDLASTSVDHRIVLLLNNGDATFARPDVYPPISVTTKVVRAADFDNDGDQDMVVTFWANTYLAYLENDGSGSFETSTVYYGGYFPRSVQPADLDGDGYLDLVVSSVLNNGSPHLAILRGDGAGGFSVDSTYSYGNAMQQAASADLNADGTLDVVAALGVTVAVFLNLGDAVLAPAENYCVDGPLEAVALADFDGDGDVDVSLSRPQNNDIAVMWNNGDGTLTPRSGCEGCCLPPTVGDMNSSGWVDITDIAVMLDYFWIDLGWFGCETEGDLDFSGVIDITDLSILIDNQFLTLTPLPPCPAVF